MFTFAWHITLQGLHRDIEGKNIAPTCLCAAGDPRPTGQLVMIHLLFSGCNAACATCDGSAATNCYTCASAHSKKDITDTTPPYECIAGMWTIPRLYLCHVV